LQALPPATNFARTRMSRVFLYLRRLPPIFLARYVA